MAQKKGGSMASGFTLSIYPWVYIASAQQDGHWLEEYQEKPHRTPQEEAALDPKEYSALLASRNSFPDLPLVNYTSQYGMGCFEGLKAFPQPDGTLKLFRPDQNAARMARSMEGLKMPRFPENLFEEAVRTVVRRNYDIGFFPAYNPDWEKTQFVNGEAVYIRPFSYSEPGIGLNLSCWPYVVVVTTPVGSYFDPKSRSRSVTTDRIRATPKGTGWIKCDANYVIPTLEKKRVQELGYMECIFLDSTHRRYVEEGSSCNIFFHLKDGTLVTPSLQDTILPGINRASIITLARDMGIPVEERPITIEEAMGEGREAFVTGTAAGVSYLESVEHNGVTAVFNDGKMGELTRTLLVTLKGIQYGSVEDTHGWMVPV
jgi:branched-chain amino acid aminotransferase